MRKGDSKTRGKKSALFGICGWCGVDGEEGKENKKHAGDVEVVFG